MKKIIIILLLILLFTILLLYEPGIGIGNIHAIAW